jgi:hypothetical protein
MRCALWALVVIPVSLPAQQPGMPDGSRERAAIAPLTKLVGVWEGPGSAMTGPGQMRSALQREVVELGAGGTVLIVRGTGVLKEEANRVIHDAVATIWFDAAANKLKMRAHRMEGVVVEPDLELKGDTLVWGFAVAGGRIRYTTVFSSTDWHEVGHFIREGAAPILTMEMRLKKIG